MEEDKKIMKLFKRTDGTIQNARNKKLILVYKGIVIVEFLLPLITFALPFVKLSCLEDLNTLLFRSSSLFVYKIDTFATIATVLVGVYFSLLTLLLTTDGNSMLSKLDSSTLKKISIELSWALGITSIYMFSPLLANINQTINNLLFAAFLLIFLQTIQIGIYFFIIIIQIYHKESVYFKGKSKRKLKCIEW